MKNPFKDKANPGELHTSPIVRRYENNPLLTAADVPYPATLVFNAGVAFYKGLYYIAPRVDLFDEKRSTPALNICTEQERKRRLHRRRVQRHPQGLERSLGNEGKA